MLATVGMISAFSRKSALRTPTISNCVIVSVPVEKPLSTIVLPTMFGSPLSARFQNL
jgi:hypothetical protein